MIDVVVSTRPNFVKAAPLLAALRAYGVEFRLVHTGQHYDKAMCDSFFERLALPAPEINLCVRGGIPASQTGRVCDAYGEVLAKKPPEAVLVLGDCNGALGAGLAAAYRDTPVIHYESGLRSGDRSMPEETNRMLVDRLARLHLTTTDEAKDNLLAEGVPRAWIHHVGNLMIDALHGARETAWPPEPLASSGIFLRERDYGVVTLHRPHLVDDKQRLRGVLETIGRLSSRRMIVWPLHPRTRDAIAHHKLLNLIEGIVVCGALSYPDMIALAKKARWLLTDSGGISEEACVMGVGCAIARENTERACVTTLGLGVVCGIDPRSIERTVLALDALPADEPRNLPPLWDGHTASRCARAISSFMNV